MGWGWDESSVCFLPERVVRRVSYRRVSAIKAAVYLGDPSAAQKQEIQSTGVAEWATGGGLKQV